MIAFACTHCGFKLKVHEQFAGRASKCPTCKQPLVVPAAGVAVNLPRQIDGQASSLGEAGQGGVTLAGQLGVAELLAQPRARGERYVVAGEIARGGMGAVLRAVDCDIRREVAVKYMLDQSDPKKKARFIEEAQVTGQLEHPNIVPIYDLGMDAQKRLFFSMKIIKGRSLKDVLDQPRPEFTLGRLLNVLVNVCNALACAHARGVVHRDLKPANIMLGDFGEVYVMDWGLAKVLHDQRPAELPAAAAATAPPSSSRNSKVATSREPETDLTQEGSVLGTPVYMPPEQAAGTLQAIDQRSDIYSLGAILYEVLTGQPPVSREGGHLAILLRVMNGEIVPPEQRAPQRARAGRIPAELAAVAMKALAKQPADRYPRMDDFRQDIERFQEGRSVSAKQDTTREMLWKLVKRNKAVSAALLFFFPLLVLLCGFTLVNYLRYAAEQKEKDRRTKLAVPALVRSARLMANEGQWAEALTQIDLARTYDPASAEALLLKGQVLVARKDFAAGQAELGAYLQLRPEDAAARQLAAAAGRAQPGDAASLVALAAILQRQKASGLAVHLLRDVARAVEARRPLLALYQKQVEATWPGLGNRLTMDSTGAYFLNLAQCKQVTALEPLRGMQLSGLELMGCSNIADLTPLAGMPLTRLGLANCRQVRDLAPLRGMPLNHLDASGLTQVTDLTPLQGMPLTWLSLVMAAQLRDLTPLQGMPLTYLNLGSCGSIADLTPLRGMRLTSLGLHNCSQVWDLTPLRGMPLTHLELGNCSLVRELTPLQGMRLKTLTIGGCSQVRDLTPLRGMPLASLGMANCTQVRDLTPLVGMPLNILMMGQSGVRDLTPLQDSSISELGISPRLITRGMDVLRRMKNLKSIELGTQGRFTPEEFLKRYEAGEFK